MMQKVVQVKADAIKKQKGEGLNPMGIMYEIVTFSNLVRENSKKKIDLHEI